MTRALLTASVLVLGLNAFAAGNETAQPAAPAPAPAAKAAHGGYAKAKEECLKENSGLKGKALRKCIKEKEGKGV